MVKATTKFQEQINMFIDIVKVIFKSKNENTDIANIKIRTNTGEYLGRWFVNKTVRGFDFEYNPGKKKIALRILEQNPNKTDKYGNLTQFAILAREGKHIAWIIRTDTNEFVGRIVNNAAGVYEFERSKPRALTTTTSMYGGYKTTPVEAQDQFNQTYNSIKENNWIADLPEIDPSDIPLYVVGI